MHKQNTTPETNKASHKIQETSVSFGLHLNSLYNYLQFLSKDNLYCWISTSSLSNKYGLSTSTIQRYLKELEDVGAIVRERVETRKRGGSRRIIWTKTTYQKKGDILSKNPISQTIGVRTINHYVDPNAEKILSNAIIVSSPICYKNNSKINKNFVEKSTKNTLNEQSNEQSNEHPILSSHIEYRRVNEEEVVIKKPTQHRSNRHAPKTPPIFLNREQQRMSNDQKASLVEIYGNELVEKKVRNFENVSISAWRDHPYGKFCQTSEFEHVRLWCNETSQRRAKDNEMKKAMATKLFEQSKSKAEVDREKVAKIINDNKDLQSVLTITISSVDVNLFKINKEAALKLNSYSITFGVDRFDEKFGLLLNQLRGLNEKAQPSHLNRPTINQTALNKQNFVQAMKIDPRSNLKPSDQSAEQARYLEWKKQKDIRRYGPIQSVCTRVHPNSS
jgi:predicted transcriptional regulator